MDLTKLASMLMSSDSVAGLSDATGASKSEVTSVLKEALPSLLSGATNQAKDASTAEGFANALSSHAKADTSSLTNFLGNIDIEDGSKIIGHLLGSEEKSVTCAVSKSTGVSGSKTNKIMAAAGPLLMSLLGQQADEDDDKESGVGSLIGGLLDNVDIGDILSSVVGTSSGSSSSKKKKKKKASSTAGSGIGNLIGGVLGKLLK